MSRKTAQPENLLTHFGETFLFEGPLAKRLL
jgi:hypothetical protein